MSMIRSPPWSASLWSVWLEFFGVSAVCRSLKPRSLMPVTLRCGRPAIGRPIETEDEAVEDREESDWKASVLLGKALIDDARYSDALGKLARHEATLMNAFTKTLQMLLLLQEDRAKRKGEPAVLEAVALPPAA